MNKFHSTLFKYFWTNLERCFHLAESRLIAIFFLYHNKKYGFLFIALVKINGIFNKDCPHNNIYDLITLWNKCHVRLYISKQTVYVPLVIKFNQFYFFFFSWRQVWFWLKRDPKSRIILVKVHFHFLKVYLPSHRNLEEEKKYGFQWQN